jgi:site-specific recombinase XerD
MAKRSAAISVLPDPNFDPWPSLWQSFERGLRAGSGMRRGKPASSRTVEIYGDGGRQFHQWSLERNLPTDPQKIDKAQIESFLIWLRVEHLAKPATVRARFSALRRFFNWCVEENEIEHSPMQRMRGEEVPESDAPVLSDQEQKALLDACRGDEFEDRRDMAILGLMIDTGLRRQEIAAITIDDIDLDALTIAVTRKGNKAGYAYFGSKAARDIDRYIRVRARHPHASLPAMWLAQKGALTGDGVHHLVTRRARKAGIVRIVGGVERTAWPHLLRHTFGDQMKRVEQLSDEVVMTLGGWTDAKAMRRYGRSAAQARAREAHRRHSPRDRI